jgi:hypothetical protein
MIQDVKIENLTRFQLLKHTSLTVLTRAPSLAIEHYLRLGFSHDKIAETLNSSTNDVEKVKKIYDIRAYPLQKRPHILKDIYTSYFKNHNTPSEISLKTGIDEWTILSVLEEHMRNLVFKKFKTAQHPSIHNYEYLKRCLEEKMPVYKIAEKVNTYPRKIRKIMVSMGLLKKKSSPKTPPYINKNGYRMILANGRTRAEHTYVWQQHNGPKPNNMHIHHINFNKLDNRIENLLLVDRKTHSKLHSIIISRGKELLLKNNLHKEIILEMQEEGGQTWQQQ